MIIILLFTINVKADDAKSFDQFMKEHIFTEKLVGARLNFKGAWVGKDYIYSVNKVLKDKIIIHTSRKVTIRGENKIILKAVHEVMKDKFIAQDVFDDIALKHWIKEKKGDKKAYFKAKDNYLKARNGKLKRK